LTRHRPHRALFGILLAATFAALAMPGAVGAARPPYSRLTGPQVVDVLAGGRVTQAVPIEADAGPTSRTGGSTVDVVYDSGFGANPAARNAFQRAVNIVKARIVSPVRIRVKANWVALGSGVLGSAGPGGIYLSHADDRSYAVSVLERKLGRDINGTEPDIVANFSSAYPNWHFGTGPVPSNRYDFVTVVLHELLHGLGFIGSLRVSGSTGQWGWGSGDTIYKMRYDEFQWTSATAGKRLVSAAFPNPSAVLRDELTDGSVYFGGPNVTAVLGGRRARLYAPRTWSGGSSNAHFNEGTYAAGTPNALMTPQLGMGEQIRALGPLTLAMMRDIGYPTN
jgi:hypothetical protein